MTLQKRRVIYMTDQEWAALQMQADSLGISMSALLRSRVTAEPIFASLTEGKRNLATETAHFDLSAPGGDTRNLPAGPSLDRSAQQERDAILRKVNRGSK